jgi:hypothetical protein
MYLYIINAHVKLRFYLLKILILIFNIETFNCVVHKFVLIHFHYLFSCIYKSIVEIEIRYIIINHNIINYNM